MAEDEPLINLRPKSDFEKYIWERNKRKETEVELGKANARVHELEDKIKTIRQDILDEILPDTKNKTEVKNLILRVKSIKDELEKQKIVTKKATVEKRQLMEKVISLNSTIFELNKTKGATTNNTQREEN